MTDRLSLTNALADADAIHDNVARSRTCSTLKGLVVTCLPKMTLRKMRYFSKL
jgi:hypothetical protein